MRALTVLLILFFGSGACGLIYQVLWLRQLSLVFGVTVYAASTVLAAFMAGLALGSLAAARVAARVSPLRAFGAIELAVGATALATPIALDAASTLYDMVRRIAPDSFGVITAARLLGSMAILLLPTVLMGMTLPLLSASAPVQGDRAKVGALYAANTAGALFGASLAGFVLIGGLGMRRSFLLAASINTLVGIGALWLARSDPAGAAPEPGAPEPSPAAGDQPARATGHAVSRRQSLLLIAALSGFAALALEIVWFRIIVQFISATAYAFTTMLATVLGGIAVGSALAARALGRDADWHARLMVWFAASAVAVPLSLTILGFGYAAGWRLTHPVQVSVAAMLPASVLMGVTFPILLHLGAVSGSTSPPAVIVGRLYAANVIGAIGGALAGGFLILPVLGARRSAIAVSALYLLCAVMVRLVAPVRWRAVAWTGAAAAVFAASAAALPDPMQAAHVRRHGNEMQEFWREEGLQATVSVHANQFHRTLFIDGLHQANDTHEMVTLHRDIGHLGMVLHPDPRQVLVVGLGGGATAGAVTQYPNSRIQIVELSSSVTRAAPFFSHVTYGVLTQPNVALRIDDGRSFLRYNRAAFDVITADIIQPIQAGAGALYSREYFQLARAALAEGGLAVQWIGHRTELHYKAIMRTFLEVFPDASLWMDGHLMVGSRRPVTLSRSRFEALRADPRTRAALDDVGLTDFEVLKSWYRANAERMRTFASGGAILTDDWPLLEYYRSMPSGDRPLDLTSLRSDVSPIVEPQ
jgi:spermidine synthase